MMKSIAVAQVRDRTISHLTCTLYCMFGSHFYQSGFSMEFCEPVSICNNFNPIVIRKLCLNISGSSRVLEEDMLILRVVEAYCTSARARHTLNSKCQVLSL